jgi:hypothetical protein
VNQSNGVSVFTPLKYEICNLDKHIGKYKSLFENLNITNYNCISPGQNFNLYGSGTDVIKGSGLLSIFIAKCDNSSIYNPNPGKCASPSTIETALSSSPPSVGFLTIDHQIDNNALGDPYIPYIYADLFTVVPNYLLYRHHIILSKSFYSHDDGYIFENKNTYESYQKVASSFDIFVNTTLYVRESYGVLIIDLPGKADSYLKSYVKLQVIIANIGGIIKSLLLIASLLNYQVKSALMMTELINNYFDHSEEKPNRTANNIESNNFFNNKTLTVARKQYIFNLFKF